MTLRLNVLIIEPDRAAQRRLKLALNNAFKLSELHIVKDFVEVDRITKEIEQCDIIFISNRLNAHHVSDFIQETKSMLALRDAANILLLDYSSGDSANIANRMLEGIDGFLVEPYSIESLQEIAKVAQKAKLVKAGQREKSAITILTKEIMVQLDHLAALKKTGAPAKISEKVLQEMTAAIRRLDADAIQTYYSVVFEEFPKAPAVRVSSGAHYMGSSQRVRKKIAKKALDKIAEAFAA